MPITQLRLFNAPLSLIMKYPLTQTPRPMSTLSRMFPHKLKYHAIGLGSSSSSFSNNLQFMTFRKLSTRPFKARPATRSEFNSSGSRGRNEIRAASKSLIDDEAELSDWVSELRTDSFRGKLTSEDESDSERGFRSRVGGGRKSLKRGSNGESFNRSGGESLKRGSDGESNRRGGESLKRGRGGESFNRGGREGFKRGRESELDSGRFRNGEGSRREGRQSNSSELSGRREGRGPFERRDFSEPVGKRRSDRSLEARSSNAGNRGSRNGTSSSSVMKRGGDSRFGFDSRGSVAGSRGGFVVSDVEENDEDDIGSFRQFLSEDESEDVTEDDDNNHDDQDDDDVLTRKASSSLGLKKEEDGEKALPTSAVGDNGSYLSETRFDQCSISPLSLKGIKSAGYEKMTMVQEATLPVILKGKDVLAKAKTGTGKTVAFLLPSIEVVVNSPPVGRDEKRPPILVLVICPTRELASQAAAEANTLLKYHPSIGVQVVIGGTRLALEQKRMQANPCQILVATPGRLRDHIENTAGFATRLTGVKVLVLDEADHLLDMGFRKDIEKIIAAVPKQRQTLLFSATVPEEVRQICHLALKRDHEFISTVQEGSEETHSQVRQMHLVAPLDKHFSTLYVLLKEHIADDVDYKVLVFCTTAMVTRLVASLLGELNLSVREIHSRKPQSYRTRVSDEFRKSKGLILVTSDVSARGVDYPDVTLVVQVGLPSDREQYIHRLGRTGRKGKQGQGILLLAPWEEYFLSSIRDLPITKAPLPSVDPDTKKKVERALSQVEMKNKEAAYQAWLGFYNSAKNVGRDKHRLVELANEFSRSMGLDNPPAISKMVLGKMGLKNIPGLRAK